MKTEPYVIRDLGNKLAEDCVGAAFRTATLCDDAAARALIVENAISALLGVYIAALTKTGLSLEAAHDRAMLRLPTVMIAGTQILAAMPLATPQERG